MGMWVILIGDAGFEYSRIKAMEFEGRILINDFGEKQFDVIFDDGYVSFQFDFDEVIKHDYSSEELKNLPYNNPQFILMKYSTQRLLKSIIGSKDFPKNILIDCNSVNLELEYIVDKTRLLNNTEV